MGKKKNANTNIAAHPRNGNGSEVEFFQEIEGDPAQPVRKKRYVPKTALTDITLSPRQRDLNTLMDLNDIVVVTGPAGTSKTFVGCYYAIKSLRDHLFEKIIFTKPIQEAGERLGALPGDVEHKIDPHYESFRISMLKMVKRANLDKLLENHVIEFRPLAYMRGATFDNTLMILDEAQNADIRQIMLFVTRMGRNSKVLITGDVHQYDINANHVAFPFFVEHIVRGIDGVGVFEFKKEDIVRNKILIEITERYERIKAENYLPRNKH
jgi:phosphate starvation-inducible PhoH-like protein